MNSSKLSLGLNIGLLIAVIFLFVKVYSGPATSSETAEPAETKTEISGKPMAGAKIAFVRNDSIQSSYKFYIKSEKELQESKDAAEATLKKKAEYAMAREKKLNDEARFMTQSEQQKAMMELQNLQMDYQRKQEELMNDLAMKEQNLTDKLYQNIEAFLDGYVKEHKIDIVMNYVPRLGFLYINPEMDITADVVKGLNAEYDNAMNGK
ncbi:MAG: OmpH family outer membrane protein [Flavobacteriales bacterium]|nr:OmpH family outer membrane protein [Flavobacteriales bacterium]